MPNAATPATGPTHTSLGRSRGAGTRVSLNYFSRSGSWSDSILVREKVVNCDFLKQHVDARRASPSVCSTVSSSPFPLFVWPGGGAPPAGGGFSWAPFQTNQLSQVVREQGHPDPNGVSPQRQHYPMEGRKKEHIYLMYNHTQLFGSRFSCTQAIVWIHPWCQAALLIFQSQ